MLPCAPFWRTVALAGLLALMCGRASAQGQRTVLQLQWDNQFQFAGYYAALWQGYYQQAGFDVEIRSAFPDGGGPLRSPVTEVVEGRADFGTSNAGILLARAAGAPVTVVATIFQQSGTRLYYRKEVGPIPNPAGLVGLRLGRNIGNELLDVELRAMLAAEGINPGQIPVVRFPPDKLVQGLADGAYDMMFGYALSAPWEQRERGIEFGEMRPADYGIAFYGDSLFTRADLAHGDPDLVERFRQATLRGWRYALDNSDEVARRIATLPHALPRSDVLGYNLFQVPIVRDLTLFPVVELGNINPERWRRMMDQMARAGVVAAGTVLDTNDFIFDRERERLRRDRRVRTALVWLLGAALLLAAGFVAYSLIMRRAVQAARAELGRRDAALMQAQKLEAVGRMTGGVAHDFNNLMQVVTSGLQLLERPGADEARGRMIRANMRQAVERGTRITQQLLAFARRQPLQPERVDPAVAVAAMDGLLSQSLNGAAELRMELPPGLWPVEVDVAQLEVALLNLAVNARDAMPGGGTVTVGGANVPLSEPADAPDRLHGDYVRLDLADTGTGMPPEVAARVFEPFFTTKEIGKGTGLGLPQVYGFARQSGGTVRIQSEVGRGTTVSLFLPRAAGPVEPAAVHAAPAPTAPVRPLSVLLVEDEPDIAAFVAELLREGGHTVRHCPTPDEALRAVDAGHTFDLLLSDVVLPGPMSGLDLAHALSQRCPGLPVVLATGYTDALEAVVASPYPVLRKPFTSEGLQAALAQAASPSGGGLR